MMIVSPRRMVLAAFAWLMCLSCLLASVGCQKKMPGRLDGLYSSDTASDGISSLHTSDTEDGTSSPSDAEKTACPVPPFQAGSYDMESAAAYEHLLLSGSEIRARIAISQTYNYRIKLTVSKNGNMTAVYTFTRIRTGYEDSQTYTTDTADKKGRTEENAPYYDLIGQSFTVRVSKDYRLSISDVDKIHQKYPDTADIVTDENLLEVASDLFYPIEGELSVGSAWKRTQNGVTNTYTVSKIRDETVTVNIKGGKLTVPDPVTNNDITYTYRQCAPLSGSVVMDRHNRMIQEQSSYQSNTGDAAYNGAAYAFEEVSSSLCSIVKAS
jgi:hypothetical protein